ARDAGRRRRAGERTARDDVRRGERHDGLARQEHARERRRRQRLPRVRARDDGAEMQGRRRHQMTVRAPAFTSVVGPSIEMTAPLPFEITIPTSLTEIIAPVVVWIRIPPVGPGTSDTTIPFLSVVWSVKPFTAGGTVCAS